MTAFLIDGVRDWREIAIAALGGIALFALLMAFVRTWLRGS